MKNQYNIPCNIAQTLNIIGDKWTLLIIHQIMRGKDTYKEIQNGLDGIPTNLLSERLKSLENDGLIGTELYQTHPPRYRYYLMESGRDLEDIFTGLLLWGEKHLKKCYKKLTHKGCGHSIKHAYYCPVCDKMVAKEDMEIKDMD